MKLFKISQEENSNYDTYDSAVVAAENEEQARLTTPHDCGFAAIREFTSRISGATHSRPFGEWCSSPDKVEVSYLGEAVEGTAPGTILASYNAG